VDAGPPEFFVTRAEEDIGTIIVTSGGIDDAPAHLEQIFIRSPPKPGTGRVRVEP